MTTPPRCRVGDQVRLRKPHPCGGDAWRITRTGADVGLECLTCGRRVMLDRLEFNRRLKERLASADEALPAPGPAGT